MMSTEQQHLLEVADLEVEFPGQRRNLRRLPPIRAVDKVTFDIRTGETLGLIGESGSGKTTIGRAILGLVRPTSGRIRFDGNDITTTAPPDRGDVPQRLQPVFQNPYSSLNPAKPIRTILSEPFTLTKTRDHSPADVDELLHLVGLDPSHAERFPHQFSGGQRQRIAIARAIALRPELIVCDEAVSALDVSTRSQIINLFEDLRSEFGIAYLFIGHDLSVVRHISHRIAVLYRGQVVEIGDADAVSEQPAHPYTRALIAAVPLPDPEHQARRRQQRTELTRQPTGPPTPTACPFAHRCPHVMDMCRTQRPALRPTPSGTAAACHLYPTIHVPPHLERPES